MPRPKWGELAARAQLIPLDESIQKVSHDAREIHSTAREAVTQHAKVEKLGSVGVPQARGFSALQTTGPHCDFDATERRLIDFRLPDTSGKMVSFRELDADLILLDFWGSWCAPCRKSIPHLVGLHRELAAGKKLIVVGIASEHGTEKERAAAAAKAVKELGINYPVLISSMNADCPVKEALQVQFYPTMILLDRSGRLLWREQGATETTMARMDRFIGKNLSRPDLARGGRVEARTPR